MPPQSLRRPSASHTPRALFKTAFQESLASSRCHFQRVNSALSLARPYTSARPVSLRADQDLWWSSTVNSSVSARNPLNLPDTLLIKSGTRDSKIDSNAARTSTQPLLVLPTSIVLASQNSLRFILNQCFATIPSHTKKLIEASVDVCTILSTSKWDQPINGKEITPEMVYGACPFCQSGKYLVSETDGVRFPKGYTNFCLD
ncbi:hypothetical protein C8R43DRAFT_957752 [Mycena crocata]|nr:hypothetical protein C8R43DRAFT_957752 [Mycena crocata]